MIQPIINFMLVVLTFLFTQLKHPLAMGFLLMIQTIIVCLITGNLTSTFWFSYSLFLVFVGGMLVLFIYVTSLASNEMFNLSMKLSSIIMLIMFMLLLISLMFDNSMFLFNNNSQMMNMNYMDYFKEGYQYINKLYNFPTNYMTLMLINYLFFTLIVVVKITNFFSGPLRNLN